MTSAKDRAFRWVDENHGQWSRWNSHIWNLAETAWREYRSGAWYVAKLREEGFDVEEGSGGMPTAFSASWSNGPGPTIMAYAEYDAVPGNCQDAVPWRAPRPSVSAPCLRLSSATTPRPWCSSNGPVSPAGDCSRALPILMVSSAIWPSSAIGSVERHVP